MKGEDINDTLRTKGPDATRIRLGKAQKYKSNGGGGTSVGEDAVQLEDFIAYMPQGNFIFVPTGDLRPASSVNAGSVPLL
jgi:hypothetical protein